MDIAWIYEILVDWKKSETMPEQGIWGPKKRDIQGRIPRKEKRNQAE